MEQVQTIRSPKGIFFAKRWDGAVVIYDIYMSTGKVGVIDTKSKSFRATNTVAELCHHSLRDLADFICFLYSLETGKILK